MIVSCLDLAKTYAAERGEIEAVRGIDFEMQSGEFASIVGRSGSGKSSFLAMIGGLSRPSRGSVRIEDTDIWGLSDDRLADFRNRRIGFVYQFASLLPTLRIIDNVLLPARLDPTQEARQPTGGRESGSIGSGCPNISTPILPRSPPASSDARSSPAP